MIPRYSRNSFNQLLVLGTFLLAAVRATIPRAITEDSILNSRQAFTSCESSCENQLQAICNKDLRTEPTCLCDNTAPGWLQDCLTSSDCKSTGVLLNWWERTCGKTVSAMGTTSVSSTRLSPATQPTATQSTVAQPSASHSTGESSQGSNVQIGSILIGIAVGAVFVISLATGYIFWRRRKTAGALRRRQRTPSAVEEGRGTRSKRDPTRNRGGLEMVQVADRSRRPSQPPNRTDPRIQIGAPPKKRHRLSFTRSRPERTGEVKRKQVPQGPQYTLPRPPETAHTPPSILLHPSRSQSPLPNQGLRLTVPSSRTPPATSSPVGRVKSMHPTIMHTDEEDDDNEYDTSTISTTASTDGDHGETSTIFSTSESSEAESHTTQWPQTAYHVPTYHV